MLFNMKKFTLEEYLKNPSKQLVTRAGYKARIICTDKKDVDYSIVALIDFKGKEEALCYTKNGCFYYDERKNENDLFFAPEKCEGWMNIYRDSGTRDPRGGYIYNSEKEAKKEALPDVITTLKLEWEE